MTNSIIIYAGAKSPTWDSEANELANELKKLGYKIVTIIPINGLNYPRIEYLK